MIGFLQGKLLTKAPPFLLVDVQGVGYEIEAPMTTFYDLPEIGEAVILYTHLQIRDDAHCLYAFSNLSDRQMFRHLIKVNGIGPKLALTILSGQSADEFNRCVRNQDVQTLVRLPGVGKKTAERLIIEMRDRLPKVLDESGSQTKSTGNSLSASTNNPREEAISALSSLGYKPAEASKMIDQVATDDLSCEQMIRLALQASVNR